MQHTVRRALSLVLVLAACGAVSRAETGMGTATATVVDPLSFANSQVNTLLDHFPVLMVVPSAGPEAPVRSIPNGMGAPGNAGGAGAGPTAPASSGGVQTVRNPDGSMSLNVTGGTSLAHVITRSADGQLHVDFN